MQFQGVFRQLLVRCDNIPAKIGNVTPQDDTKLVCALSHMSNDCFVDNKSLTECEPMDEMLFSDDIEDPEIHFNNYFNERQYSFLSENVING